MSLRQLVDQIESLNIAEDLDEPTLMALGKRVKETYERDWDSMKDWREQVEEGIKLMEQEYKPKSTPWQGASNYKDPLINEASIRFGDKASLELLKPRDLIGSSVIGRDPEGQKKALGERVSEAMNYQINHKMADWRKDQKRLFYTLPTTGDVFKMVVYDGVEEECESVMITYPDFAVNQATKSMDKARAFSHCFDLSANEVAERVMCGKWLDPDAEMEGTKKTGKDVEGDKGSNEEQGEEKAANNEQRYIQQQCFFDLDEDGYEEPYIVTIKEKTCRVVRIVARYDDWSIIVKREGKIMPLPEAIKAQQAADSAEYGGMFRQLIGTTVPEVDISKFELQKIVPFQNVVKYGFIPNPDGTFLDLGYAHLMGAIVQAINTGTNQLSDRATLNNVGGGFLSKEFRKTTGRIRIRMGEYQKTDVPAAVMKNGIYEHPVTEPSQTLYQMVQDMLERGSQFLATVDVSGKIQANTAPTTALAIIQEAVVPTTALFQSIIDSETEEFRVLFRINKRTFPKDLYQQILASEEVDPQADFDDQMIVMEPTANAEMSSRLKRMQTAQIEMEALPTVVQAGGNPGPIVRGYFEAIGSQVTEEVFPEDQSSISEQDRAMMQQMQEQQQIQNQIAQQQLQLLQREQDRLDRDTEAKVAKARQEIKNMQAEIIETFSQAAWNVERAETEQLKNRIDQYAGLLEGILAGAQTQQVVRANPQLPESVSALSQV